MLEVPRREQHVSVALPASFTRDIPHLREKTGRVGFVARTLAIFRVNRVVIYDDEPESNSRIEGQLFHKLLSYSETPQHIRRRLFGRDPELQFAGILPPIRSPSHPTMEPPYLGMVREGVVIRTGIPSEVDIGFEKFVLANSKLQVNRRVTVKLTQTEPSLAAEVVQASRLRIYWGFEVTRSGATLSKLIKGEKPDLTISTSRNGQDVRSVLAPLAQRWSASKRTLVLFGSPSKEVREILAKETVTLDRVADFEVNTVPNQGTETVRTEEALLATLSILNILEQT